MENLTSWLFSSSPPPTTLAQLQELKFFVHDELHSVKIGDVSPETTLNSYLRKKADLTGTKNMCLEGGCGACIVAVTVMDPVTDREMTLAVNSCLVPIYLCSGWKIHTVESVGSPKEGYHPVQKALVKFNGTQCGFCSSGMVMNMYALYESGQFTMKDVENSFGGNMCRCTGYRPIMSAFKSLASDASEDVLGKISDIEDIPICKRNQGRCEMSCAKPCTKSPHFYAFGATRWIKVFSINEILDVIKGAPDASYMLVGGDTARGVYKRTKEPDIYIDVTGVKNLLGHTLNKDSLVLGANMSLTNAMGLFYKLSKENKQFSYLEKLADHIDLIANVPVRNTGTLAGNLFTKHLHHEFPSDIYLIFKTAGATLSIVGANHAEDIIMSMVDFLSYDMKGKIITKITLPALDESYRYESYKIMPRAQNAHALVNAGFLFKLTLDNKVESANIIYGCISPTFTHASNAEKYLVGKDLFSNETLQGLFTTLDNTELQPDHVLPDPTPEFRKKLAIALCYKFILSIAPDGKASPRNKSGGQKQVRPVSSGTQDYQTNESLYPLTQPISKIEALAQCSGQAKYVMDMPDQPGQQYAAFVLAKAPAGSSISKIDPSEALKLEGVTAFYDKSDIPGRNDFMPKEYHPIFIQRPEEIFCSGVVKFFFQPVGIVVADTQELAEKAAEMVQISYLEAKNKPLLTIREILAAKAENKIHKETSTTPKSKGTDIKHVIKGTFDVSWQYYYTMETQCCVAIPVEDGLDLYPSTQSMTLTQTAAAKVLDIPLNKINVTVRRVGGAYGAKISRSCMISCAAALAAYKLKKPVKLSMPLITNMNVIGKRGPFASDYEVGVNDRGAIQYLTASMYSDLGSDGGNENFTMELLHVFGNIYKRDTWGLNVFTTTSDCHTGTWCRAPGTTEAIGSIEGIMQHIASVLNINATKVRLENLSNAEIPKYIADLAEFAELEKRKKDVQEFNKANRWVKRGIEVVPMLFPLYLFGSWHVYVSIYQADGSVSITHGGIEMGQGINTKVAQVCAHCFGIPLDQISIKPSSVLTAPNDISSGGSLTSEAVCSALIQACDTLKDRMKPIKAAMKDPTWQELVQKCFQANVDLSASSLFDPTTLERYPIYGATCVEVEVDILTGLCQVRRVDIVEDAGNSLSPQIDIGQVEGAFVMGMGYWTSEQIVYGEDGELLTNRTWTYKPPGAKDIPVDFRVKFPKNNPYPKGVFHSKATAEPPLCMACALPFAIRNAVGAARVEADPNAEKWYPIDGPSTVENTFVNSLHDYKQYKL